MGFQNVRYRFEWKCRSTGNVENNRSRTLSYRNIRMCCWIF